MKKIALPIKENKQIDDHFGHCDYYGIYTISDENQISNFQVIQSNQGCGCKSNIASILAKQGVSTMLAGGIGAGAINVLNNEGIQVIRGCSGEANKVVEQYLAGKISDSGESCAQHEHHHDQGHEHGHTCNH